ncbi:hypothetical protein [Frankia sp. R43]|nr:hypothetical protein [Frankia sp. R43]
MISTSVREVRSAMVAGRSVNAVQHGGAEEDLVVVEATGERVT